MSKHLSIWVRTANEGTKVQVTASPSVIQYVADEGGNATFTSGGDVQMRLSLPGGADLEPVEMVFKRGSEE